MHANSESQDSAFALDSVLAIILQIMHASNLLNMSPYSGLDGAVISCGGMLPITHWFVSFKS